MRQKSAKAGLVTIGETSLLKAQGRVIACQNCSASVSRPFGSVLTEALGAAGPFSEYMLCGPAECPNCAGPMVENTLVRCEGELEQYTPAPSQDFGSVVCDETNVVLVDEAVIAEAQAFISGCQQCDRNAEMTFDYILDAITEFDPTVTEYMMCRPAKCPRCEREITEKTLIVA